MKEENPDLKRKHDWEERRKTRIKALWWRTTHQPAPVSLQTLIHNRQLLQDLKKITYVFTVKDLHCLRFQTDMR